MDLSLLSDPGIAFMAVLLVIMVVIAVRVAYLMGVADGNGTSPRHRGTRLDRWLDRKTLELKARREQREYEKDRAGA